jgi:hypothetical protein
VDGGGRQRRALSHGRGSGRLSRLAKGLLTHRGTFACRALVSAGAVDLAEVPVPALGWLMLLRLLTSASEITIARIAATIVTLTKRGR